ncbi:diphthine--ammonia ligase [Flavobacterium amniphilum]|uniref:Dph6-related ATP pyrophosphatase n=1 Tax=Flavobacterium amniphilum TaxID=1834035 RepID=UPI002029CE20|nr:diphthine--ammonia ligase [Flavobacterium amniphilum]MCL9807238.1 diphthine--ammonia ligase [Flavobacterium amniphilum]
MNFMTSWSGGKDSCYAMMKAVASGLKPKVLLNMMNENGKVSRSHGLPLYILKQQAAKMNLPIETIPATWNDYESKFIEALQKLKKNYGLDAAVFGDIDLQPHRDWEEKVCKAAGLEAILPLWQQDRVALVKEMIEGGIQTMIVSCNVQMGEAYLGKIMTLELAEELEAKGIDPCGENGEFHTMVMNCPLFTEAITLPEHTTQTYNDYCFIVWETN